jgi:hypothetical protein
VATGPAERNYRSGLTESAPFCPRAFLVSGHPPEGRLVSVILIPFRAAPANTLPIRYEQVRFLEGRDVIVSELDSAASARVQKRRKQHAGSLWFQGVSLAAPLMDWGNSIWVQAGGSPAPSGAAVSMPAFPPLPSCPGQQTPCAQQAVNDAFNSLRLLMAGSCPSCGPQIFSHLGSQYTQAGFSQFLTMKPGFYDGTRSTLSINELTGRKAGFVGFLDWVISGSGAPPLDQACPPTTATVAQLIACAQDSAVTVTPAQAGKGLMTFLDPSKINLVPASSPTGIVNQALLFHEGLHGYTGIWDLFLEADFGYGNNAPSCVITDYIELKVWGGTIPTCAP